MFGSKVLFLIVLISVSIETSTPSSISSSVIYRLNEFSKTIFLAWKGFGVWALVAQQIMVSALSTSLYWIFGHWAPALTFSKESFKQLFNFGGFILLSNLVNTFSNNIQGLLIGKFYTPATMGYYSKARNTELLSSTFISSVIDQVSYPVLSEAQNDKAYMIRMLRKFTSVLAFITFPVMSVLALIAKPVFVFLYSDRWLESSHIFNYCVSAELRYASKELIIMRLPHWAEVKICSIGLWSSALLG